MDLTFNSQSSTPSEIVAGEFPRADRTVTLTGGAALLKGAVLGRTHVTATDNNGVAGAGNTGNGTIGTVSADDGAKAGTWRITAIAAATDGGTFQVENPDGVVVGTVAVGVAFNGAINFTIADGSTDFAVGDFFTVAVGEGTEKYKLSASAATDGSEVPFAILVDDADPSGGDVRAGVYLTGAFDPLKLNFGVGHTAATVKAPLEARNIFLRSTVAA